MSFLDADLATPVTLEADEVQELHRLLGQLEDWLRHASEEVLAELGDFFDFQRPSAPTMVIDTLGRYNVALYRRSVGDRR